MKKISLLLLPLAMLLALFTGCTPDDIDPDGPNDTKVVATLKQADLIDAIAGMYAAWEEDPVIPQEVKVGETTLTAPQYQYAMARLLVDIKAGSTADVEVFNYKAAAYPERDSYDKEEIAVFNGPKNGENTEDLANVATRMMAAMAEKGQVPNQTLFERDGSAIAFSTNRATVTLARAIAAYSEDGSMPDKVSTDYLSTAATLKGFASQVVQYLRKWEETVGTVSADGSHNSGRVPPDPWENAHFIPIPWHPNCTVAADGEDQYHIQYTPYLEIEVAGVKYDAAQALGVSMAAFLDLLTEEGSSLHKTVINEQVHTYGNGVDMNAPIPAISSGYAWGPHPWYENAQEDGPLMYNGEPAESVGIDFILNVAPWFLKRCDPGDLGRYPNFFTFGAGSLELEGYTGYACPMRIFVIALRFWDYIVKNNITEDVYDALADVRVEANLYGSEQPPLALDKESATVSEDGGEVSLKVTSKDEAWTATIEGDFITVNPASGAAGETDLTITVAANTGAARTGKVMITTASGSAKQLIISQGAAPNFATIADFIKEAVTYLDVWKNTVGTVKADGTGTFENAHFIPIPYRDGAVGGDGVNQYEAKYQPYHTITVGGQELNAAQTYGTAVSVLVDLLTVEGSTLEQPSENVLVHTPGNGKKLSDVMPAVRPYFIWGPHPWYEEYDPISYNGVEMKEADLDFVLRIAPWVVVKKAGVSDATPDGRYPNYYTFGDTITYEGYEGYLSPMRMFLITLRYLEYIVNNNITENVYDALKNVKVSADLYGIGQEIPTLKGWASEFVKCLDVWANTTGKVEADGTMKGSKAFVDAHFIPIPEPADNAVGNVENQYDPKWADKIWTMTYGGTTYTSAQAWEIGIRGLLNLITAEGEAGLALMKDRNTPWTLANGTSFATAAVPSSSTGCIWGAHPWYEVDTPLKYNGADVEEAGLELIVKACSWHVVRAFVKTEGNSAPLNKIGNFQEFGTSASTLNLTGYEGLICPMRELLIVARVYKHLLDNNVDSNVYDAIKDVKFDYSLYYTK